MEILLASLSLLLPQRFTTAVLTCAAKLIRGVHREASHTAFFKDRSVNQDAMLAELDILSTAGVALGVCVRCGRTGGALALAWPAAGGSSHTRRHGDCSVLASARGEDPETVVDMANAFNSIRLDVCSSAVSCTASAAGDAVGVRESSTASHREVPGTPLVMSQR